MRHAFKVWMALGGLALALMPAPAQACILDPAEKLEVVGAALHAPKHSARKRAEVRALRDRAAKLIAAKKLREADRLANRALLALGIAPPVPSGPQSRC